MSVEKTSSKEEKQFAVSVAILEVIEKEGVLGVTHSKVARKAKVSRAWIYEYIGRDRNALIEFGAEVLAGYFAREKQVEIPATRAELEEQVRSGIDFLFSAIEINPVIIKIYFRFRGSANLIGNVIQKYENNWLGSATTALSEILGMPRDQAALLAELILTLRLGFAHRYVTSSEPEASRKRAEETFSYIHALISNMV